MRRKTLMAVLVGLLICCAGCQTQEETKQLAKQRWARTSAQYKLVLAQQQYDSGQYDKAAETARECVQADPESPQGHLLYGKVLLAQGLTDRAKNHLNIALEQNENLGEAWYYSGVVLEQQRDCAAALERYRRAMDINPASVDYTLAVIDALVTLGRSDEAAEILTAQRSRMPHEISLKVAAADLMVRAGQAQQAADLYEQAMLLAGDDPEIAEALGCGYILAQRWSEAVEIFEQLALECEDKQKKQSFLRLISMCSMNARQYDRAADVYGELASDHQEDSDFWLQMGQAALGAGAERRAYMCSQRALRLRPGWADGLALRGCAEYMAGDYTAAITTLEKIAADEDNAHLSALMRGRCYEQLGQKKLAQHAYEKAVQLKPESELAKLLVEQEPTDRSQF